MLVLELDTVGVPILADLLLLVLLSGTLLLRKILLTNSMRALASHLLLLLLLLQLLRWWRYEDFYLSVLSLSVLLLLANVPVLLDLVLDLRCYAFEVAW